MNELATNNQSSVTYTEQPVSAPETEVEANDIGFYIIGGVINITMILAYFIWAFGAWGKADKRKGRQGTSE